MLNCLRQYVCSFDVSMRTYMGAFIVYAHVCVCVRHNLIFDCWKKWHIVFSLSRILGTPHKMILKDL